MGTVEQSVEVQVPVRTAYNQLTRFQNFPKRREGVESLTYEGDTTGARRHRVGNN